VLQKRNTLESFVFPVQGVAKTQHLEGVVGLADLIGLNNIQFKNVAYGAAALVRLRKTEFDE
jgi:hypothetical protein